jgi:hypothetical protein
MTRGQCHGAGTAAALAGAAVPGTTHPAPPAPPAAGHGDVAMCACAVCGITRRTEDSSNYLGTCHGGCGRPVKWGGGAGAE